MASADATTSEEKKVFETGKTRTQTVHATPELKKLYVSLMLDESLGAKKDEIALFVKNAVGFNDGRDSFSAGTTTFVEEGAAAADGTAEKAAPEDSSGSRPSPMVEMLLRRGVELLCAGAFLFLLLKSLKGMRKSAAAGEQAGADAPSEPSPDAELVARVQVEELVRTDPRRVGEILSRWAGDEAKTAKAGR